MPIVDIEIVLRPGESLRPGLASDLADIAGDIFGLPPGGTWVKITPISTHMYAENNVKTGTSLHPVFFLIIKSRLPPPELLAAEVQQLTNAVAGACNRPPENVHIIYQPDGAGRVSFGGRLVSV